MTQTQTSRWPRSGGDHGNRSRVGALGPTEARIITRIPLQASTSSAEFSRPVFDWTRGGAVASDGTLRVTFCGMLHAFTNQGELLWSRDLLDDAYDKVYEPSEDDDDEDVDQPSQEDIDSVARFGTKASRFYHSLPTIIGADTTLICMRNTAALYDHQGQLVRRVGFSIADDSGLAPNCDLEGVPILTCVDGEVHAWEYERFYSLCFFGFDIVPVAVFDDNSLAVSGYARKGLCRIARDGRSIWQTTLKDADFLPTINQQQYSAVGSLNDHCSMIFNPDGQAVGSYPQPALFAEYIDGGWIALSETSIARLTLVGDIVWQHPFASFHNRHCYQPLVDSSGRIYAVSEQSVICCDGDGEQLFSLAFDTQPGPLFPIRPGVFGTVVEDTLLFLQ